MWRNDRRSPTIWNVGWPSRPVPGGVPWDAIQGPVRAKSQTLVDGVQAVLAQLAPRPIASKIRLLQWYLLSASLEVTLIRSGGRPARADARGALLP